MINTKPSVAQKIDYLNPDVPAELPWFDIPLIRATPQNLSGFGELVTDPENHPIEIVQWPAAGWRPVDPGTGNEAGTTKGNFNFWWEGDLLFGRNEAVQDEYLLGWSKNPGDSRRDQQGDQVPDQVLLWHANYHPDGGQLFYPLNHEAFVCPLALPGDDVQPSDFIAFYFDGSQGLYIHPNVWHEGIFPLVPTATFSDEQGRVHGRISCHIAKEFNVFLRVPLRAC